MPDEVDTLVAQWLSQDQNEVTRNEIISLQRAGETGQLRARLAKRIAFGTAGGGTALNLPLPGLRAPMEAGFARMNDLTVLQASQGLCAYILEQTTDAASRGIVIGHDHRHNSSRFARLTAGVFIRAGIRVYLLEGHSCTPLVPFSVVRLAAAGGVMITASHNPAKDNGYKVYWSNGVQIIPPHDSGIAASIDSHLEVSPESWTPDEILSTSDKCINQTEQLTQAYIETLASVDFASTKKDRLRFVYTPMHGVGLPFVRSTLSAFNFPAETMHIVASQAEANPDFPTVKFPNPEEKGALSEAMKVADEKQIPVVFANDPDADRFSVAERYDGHWRQFTGDQIGVMLGSWIFKRMQLDGQDITKMAMLASTVSSKMLAIIAQKEGFHFRETLTGFKWLGNAALELEREGWTAAFAYEEAIGYMVSRHIRDKDGVSALAYFACLTAELYGQGSSLSVYLASLYDKYGHFVNLNSYWICRDSAKTARLFGAVRKSGPSSSYPERLGDWRIARLKDVTEGFDTAEADQTLRVLPVDKSGQMLSFELEVTSAEKGLDGLIGTVRSSGTEPKIKYYLEGWGSDKIIVEKALERLRDALSTEWLKVEQEGLELP